MRLLVILSFFISLVYANHVNWQGDYEKALIKAKSENKVLMVLLIKNDCPKCKNIVKNIFTNKPYIDDLNQNIVAVIVNNDHKSSYPIEMYWSNEYPTLFFVNSKNEIFINTPLSKTITSDKIRNILNRLK